MTTSHLIGHHSSLPLVLVILYQDYRFALADIFLKRALSFLGLVVLASGLYFVVAVPLMQMTQATSSDPRGVGILLTLWMVTALLYPPLKRYAHWFVDAIILQRVDYEELREEITKAAAKLEEPEELLDEVCHHIARVLTAHSVIWRTGETASFSVPVPHVHWLRRKKASKTVAVPDQTQKMNAVIPVLTTDAPRYQLFVGELAGGRRLLSDDLMMLKTVALIVARRIDAIRVTRERCANELHEQEMTALATEAELRALRAQINPHFLFNALTTIGYLIQEAPERALPALDGVATQCAAAFRRRIYDARRRDRINRRLSGD